MITRYQNIHFQFSKPVYLGSGEVTVTIVDMLSQSIVFDEVTGKASELLVQKANDFEVTLCVKDLPFYPYSLYKVYVLTIIHYRCLGVRMLFSPIIPFLYHPIVLFSTRWMILVN